MKKDLQLLFTKSITNKLIFLKINLIQKNIKHFKNISIYLFKSWKYNHINHYSYTTKININLYYCVFLNIFINFSKTNPLNLILFSFNTIIYKTYVFYNYINLFSDITVFSTFYKDSYIFFLKKYKKTYESISKKNLNDQAKIFSDLKYFFKESKIGFNYKKLEKLLSIGLYKYFYNWKFFNNLTDKYLHFFFKISKFYKNIFTISIKRDFLLKKTLTTNLYNNMQKLIKISNKLNYLVSHSNNKLVIRKIFFQKNENLNLQPTILIRFILFTALINLVNLTFVFAKSFTKIKIFKFLLPHYYKKKIKKPYFKELKTLKFYFNSYLYLNNSLKKYFNKYIQKKNLTKNKQYNYIIQNNLLYKIKYSITNKNTKVNNQQIISKPTTQILNLYKLFWFFYCTFSFKMVYMLFNTVYTLSISLKPILSKTSNLLFLEQSKISNHIYIIKYMVVKKLIHISKKNSNFIKYFYLFFLNFFERFFKNKIFIKIYLNNEFTQKLNNVIYYLTKKYFNFQITIGKGFFLNEMLYILFYMFKYKDIFIFKHWLKINLERMFFAKHKKFFYKFKLILKDFFFLMVKLFKVKGFYLSISGKISAAGNSRKRRYLITTGFSSFSGYKYKLVYTKYTIRTKTGVLGITTALSYF